MIAPRKDGPDSPEGVRGARVVVTAPGFGRTRWTRSALTRAITDARVRGTGFRGVFVLEADGDPLELARTVYWDCEGRFGRAVPVLEEVESTLEAVKEAAVRIAEVHVGPSETFSFRIAKRGSHELEMDTPEIENVCGGAIFTALERGHDQVPTVDLGDPDVTVMAEVLGPRTLVGIVRKEWSRAPFRPTRDRESATAE